VHRNSPARFIHIIIVRKRLRTGEVIAMAIVEDTGTWVVPLAPVASSPAKRSEKPLHRIGEVRREQGTSLRSVARNLGTDIRLLRMQEEENYDLRLSDLYRWQQALEVPVADLLVETAEPLSRPVMERAKMLRVMKTAQAILEKAESAPVKRMAQMLVEQLVELMPELKGVSAWHTVGQRRSLDELGAVAQRVVSDHVISDYRHD
jgi:transcriptional regulator with XRE-family HTH domain